MARSSFWVVDLTNHWVTDDPLIPTTEIVFRILKLQKFFLPNFVLTDIPPHVNLELVIFLEGEILDDRDVDWRHGEHSRSESLGQVGDLRLLVQPDLQVLRKPVEDGVSFHVKTDLRISAGVGLVGLIKSEQFLGRGKLVTILKISLET